MKYSLVLIFLLVRMVSSAQLMSDSILIEKHYRSFHFYRPSDNTNGALIFVLHGSGGNGVGAMLPAKKLEQKSSDENFILVYPDGYKHYWNECRKAANTPPNLENINEEAFFTAMIGYFKKRYDANTKRVFVVGTSGGGHMAYKLALTMPEKITAISAIIANLPDPVNMDCAEKKVAKPVMIINGTLDPLNAWDGGEMNLGNGITLGRVRSTENTFRYWADLAGYKGDPRKESLPDTDPGDQRIIERYTFAEKGKPEVVLLKVIGGKHDYPNDIDVFVASWEFFKKQ